MEVIHLAVSSDHLSTDSACTLIERLRDALGPGRVLTEPSQIESYGRAIPVPIAPAVLGRLMPGRPMAIVRPSSAADVATTMREASALGVPVVPRGGGTGVMGAAIPIADSLVLDLGAMNRVLNLDAADLIARVEPGVILGDLAREAESRGLLFAHDPWSQPIATVGGAVETNGVGYLAAGYGVMGDQVRGLEVVLPTGEIVSWNSAAKEPGPALWRLFVGAEGTLGALTRVDVQLFPQPETRRFGAYRFPTFADGFHAITQIRAVGLRPTMIDYEESGGMPLESSANLYLAFDGPPSVTRAALAAANAICRDHQAFSRGRRAADRFWHHRHDSAYQFVRRPWTTPPSSAGPGWVYANVAVPASRVLDYCAQVVEIGRRHGVDVVSFGIWGRPEFVSFTMEGERGGSDRGPLGKAADEALRLARDLGGSIEYCHGVGLRFAHLLPEQGAAYSLLRRVKAMLDPPCVMNPGKLGLCGPDGR